MQKFHVSRLTIVLPVTALAFSIMSSFVVQQAHARWKAEFTNSPYNVWYTQQYDREGWSCCDHSDAHTVYNAHIKQGAWHVRIDGIDHEVLPHQLLDGPNPTGHAVVWYDGAGENVTIFCFAPGPLS